MTTTYPVPGSVSLLPLISSHRAKVLHAETDGEYVYATLEFGYTTDRALFIGALREAYSDVDRDTVHDQAVMPNGCRALGIAFLASDYYL